ncbi:hypothetical protein J2TS6_43760 [Paenibacillus albilobatus]|uniref:Phage protein n=1 Tax=Paenibacillus albilobatus TaxID=2716884 RepID=A0A920CBC9_9BACL|nr:hypothetical protein [Paenibacillus albilobatus]GIO33235.1 hypothetical protein J2TS6_43760 [Paenibacillus albilobatus]
MGKAPNWTQEEVAYLQDKWGVISIKTIANKLGKSINAVKLKAQRLGLGDPRMNFEGITINQLGKAIGREYSTLKGWIQRYGMPAKKKVFCQESRVLIISYSDFWNWAEQYKELMNFAKMEPNILGAEPEWVKVKRKADQLKSQKTEQAIPWTPEEDQRLVQVLQTKNMTYPDVARMFDRSESAVRRRLRDLGVKIRPTRLENHIKYTPEEVERLLQMAEQGHSYETIGRELGKSALGVRGKLERLGFDFKRRKLREEAK